MIMQKLIPLSVSLFVLLFAIVYSSQIINKASENYVNKAKIQKLTIWCAAGKPYACDALKNIKN